MSTTQKKHLSISFVSLMTLLFLIGVTGCTTIMTTSQKAKFVVVNETGETIHSVMVVHKYSDVYSNSFTIATNIAIGAVSQTNDVTYNTGVLTTGQDWWQLSWVTWNGTDTNGAEKYLTTPENFRNIVDEGEQVALLQFGNGTNNPAFGAVVTNVVSDLEGASAIVKLATDFYKPVVSAILNNESTKGFKKHVLRLSDANKVLTITIYKDGQAFPNDNNTNGWTQGRWNRFYYGLPVTNAVVFESQSGKSVTIYTKIDD